LHHFPWTGENRYSVRHIGTIFLDIVDIPQYLGTVCLNVHESAVGIQEATTEFMFRASYFNGLIDLGDHSGGDLYITDATGRIFMRRKVNAGTRTIPAPGVNVEVRRLKWER